MRIISGDLRGRKLPQLKSGEVRPTADRVREAMFSSITSMTDICGMNVLDLYAGSGGLGIEALSRGAAYGCFVERDRSLAATLRRTLEDFGLAERSDVVHGDVTGVLTGSKIVEARPELKFELVFADPPYGEPAGEEVIRLLSSCPCIGQGTLLVFEGSKRLELDANLRESSVGGEILSPRLEKDKDYGGTIVSFVFFD